MKRLIEKGLMFGNMIRVDSPAWVARYNRALKKLTGKETALAEFHIDLSGFSPEIGDEIGDLDYLNPSGALRQFILLTTEQKTAPLLNANISALRGILRRFITENESQLFSLTARDAVVGEVDDQVWSVSVPADLLSIRHVTIDADTTGNHVAEAEKLTALIERFRTESGGWWDDVLIARMIEQAKKTGDVTRHPVHLGKTGFDMADFWTSEFGGVYLFRSCAEPAMIFSQAPVEVEKPGILTLSLDDRHAVAAWLARNGLAEPVATARGADAAAILRQKMDFILIDAATYLKLDLGDGSRQDLRRAGARMGDLLPPEIRDLSALLRWVEHGGDWPVIDSSSPAYFLAIRGTPGPLRDLVNMMLAELAPQDVRALFIMHKPLFYKLYATWDDARKDYVADHLAREYLMDKQGTRAALFGPEPGMDEERPEPREPARAEPVAGPWGTPRAKKDPLQQIWGPSR